MKRIHLICNAHLDPVWQWEWEEGAAEAISTFRVAADLCDTFGDYVFCHNESILYRWVEEYEPELFQRIEKLVKDGRWHVMGGWHLQPDCNMPSGEGFVRQIAEGRKYFGEKFNKYPHTAINFDPFGHTRGLVQIMAKSGYDSYIFCRPGENDCHLPVGPFRWIGYDGSEVIGERARTWYMTPLGGAASVIKGLADSINDDETVYCLWGVGDHGGGGSQALYSAVAAKTLLWPSGNCEFYRLHDHFRVKNAVDIATDLYVAGYDQHTITLPYTPTGNKQAAMDEAFARRADIEREKMNRISGK